MDDPRVVAAVEAYVIELEAGHTPDREAFLTAHADVADALAKCLDGLEVVYGTPARTHGGENVHLAAELQGVASGAPLGDFRIVREVGRGGMGIVYEAEQLSLKRTVALKVLPLASALDPKHLRRFQHEAEAAAHLHHTHIVPVYAVGCERGVHYYVMQYIDGQPLSAVIQEMRRGTVEQAPSLAPPAKQARTLALREEESNSTRPIAALSTERSTHAPVFFRTVAQLGVQAAEALEHAHQQGIIHRDIKPANLLLASPVASVPGGHLWVTDFGLARLQNETGLTQTGDMLGTLRYMSPEQALGQHARVDQRTDVYALGATLYELLTLQPVLPGANRQELLRQIEWDEPAPLRRRNPAVPAELETIVHKALAKLPGERYATAQELADDLRRFLEDKPIRAKRPSLRQRLKKWARRHKPVVVTAGVSAAAALVLAVVLLAVGNVRIARREAETRAREAETQVALYFNRIALAEREWSANNLGRMQQLLDECPDDLRGWEWHYLRRLRFKTLPPLRHSIAVSDAAFSPDGRRIASTDLNGGVKVWDAAAGSEVFRFQAHESHAVGVAFSRDGQCLATSGRDGMVKLWDALTGQPIRTLKGHRAAVESVAFSSDGRRLASAGGRGPELGEVKVWDLTSGQELFTLAGHTSKVHHVTFSPNGQYLASAGLDAIVKVWDAETGRERLTFRGHSQPVWKVAFSPDGLRLASAAGAMAVGYGEVKVWDVQTGRETLHLRGHTALILSVAFSPDGQRLATGGFDTTVKLWDTATGQETLTLRGHHNFWIKTLAFSADGGRLLSACYDGTVRVWDATPLGPDEKGEEILTLRGHRGGVRSVVFRPDGQLLVSAGEDGSVLVWDALTGRELLTLAGHNGRMRNLVFDSRGERLALGGARVKVWDATTWKELLTIPAARGAVTFSPDDRYLASGGRYFTVKLWDAATGQEIQEQRDHKWTIFGLAFRPDGRVLASASCVGAVRLWDVTTRAEIEAPQLRHATAATALAFSPDGQSLASASLDQTVKVWDTKSWQQRRTFRDPTGAVQSVAWHPDGRRLVWGGTDATVKVGDLTTGSILHTFRGHASWVESVTFSPDGQWIASASLDGTVKIWKTPPLIESPGPAVNNPDK